MRVVMFYHSLVSDWNHGNAHFLRGIAGELIDRGVDVRIFEPSDGWSRSHLLEEQGPQAVEAFERVYPTLRSELYDASTLHVDDALRGADLVLVHEWNDHALVAAIGAHRANHPHYRLLFHDTHHRSITDPASMSAYDLRTYDGVLAFGDRIRDLYLARGWARRAWTWHEAADTRVFYPRGADAGAAAAEDDVVWIGNWGDEERTAEIEEFLLKPVQRLGLRAAVYGVRYPPEGRARLADHGVAYRGWLPNYDVPAVFARHAVTVHLPRRPYVESLPGVPTIRPFEAMACGIPFVSARWRESGGLFDAGDDFLVAEDGDEMAAHLAALVSAPERRRAVADHALGTIRRAHTCAHRVDALLSICAEIEAS
jgi:spore maturation protein CgeB